MVTESDAGSYGPIDRTAILSKRVGSLMNSGTEDDGVWLDEDINDRHAENLRRWNANHKD